MLLTFQTDRIYSSAASFLMVANKNYDAILTSAPLVIPNCIEKIKNWLEANVGTK